MIEITSFLFKHLYELMADDYSAGGQQSPNRQLASQRAHARRQPSAFSYGQQSSQETNQQIVSFLANNHLPDLICETFIELLFISVFLTVSWIFVMIVQLHCHQVQQPARLFYCNTKFLSSLMYCNNKSQLLSN